ncbi:MAG: substrate-binding domain-containing protein, partial [Pseudorhodobacter sp.]
MLKPLAFITAMALSALPARADEMKLAVTTSFANSGLAEVLLPQIEEDTGITVQLLVVGTGQALALGTAGDVDAVLVHSRAAEDAWLATGNGTHRREVMYNDFVIVGPSGDPAKAAAVGTAPAAFQAIAEAKAAFV